MAVPAFIICSQSGVSLLACQQCCLASPVSRATIGFCNEGATDGGRGEFGRFQAKELDLNDIP